MNDNQIVIAVVLITIPLIVLSNIGIRYFIMRKAMKSMIGPHLLKKGYVIESARPLSLQETFSKMLDTFESSAWVPTVGNIINSTFIKLHVRRSQSAELFDVVAKVETVFLSIRTITYDTD